MSQFVPIPKTQSKMSTALHLNLIEYNHMVACGAFEAIKRKVELIRGQIVEMNPAVLFMMI
jgi:hypothetical protein